MIRQFFILIFLLLGFLIDGYGQEYSHRRFTTHDGLVQMQVVDLYQDSRGYIWIGTKLGVSKFNGETFENFTEKDGLIEPFIRDIGEDGKGNIWFATRKGLSRYDGKSFSSFPFNISAPGYPIRLTVDTFNNIWVRVPNNSYNILKFDGENYSIINDTLRPSQEFSRDIYFEKELNRVLLPVNYKGLCAIENDSISIIHQNDSCAFLFEFDSQLNHLLFTEINSNGERSRYIFKADTLIPLFKTSPQAVLEVNYEHLSKNYYFTFRYGLWCLNKEKKEVELIHLPKVNMVNNVLLDKEGNLWVGVEEGLVLFWGDKGFEHFASPPFTAVYNLVEDSKGDIWFGGLTGKRKVWNGNRIIDLPDYEKNSDFATGIPQYYYGALRDQHDNLLFPMSRNILRYDGSQFSTVESKGTERDRYNLFLWEDKEADLIFSGVKGGVNIMNNYKVIDSFKQEDGVHPCNYIVSIEKDQNGEYWIGSYAGLSRFNLETRKVDNYTSDKGNLPSGGVISMLKDDRGNMWFGSKNGLLTYNYQNDTIYNVSPELNTIVNFLVQADTSLLLLGTVEGLYFLDLEKFYSEGETRYKFFNHRNGYLGIEPNQNTWLKDSKGQIWVASAESLDKFDPRNLNMDIPTLNTRVTHVNKEKLRFSATSFMLPRGENTLEFRFEGIGMERPHNTQYAYKLEGWDKEWSAWREDDFAVYSKLASGDYTFKVRSRLGGHSEVEPKVAVLRVTINLPFWKEPNFFQLAFILFGGAVLLLFFLLGGFYFFRRKALQKEREAEAQKRKSQYLRVQASLAQMNPHFTFNVLQSMQGLIISEDWKKADEYLVQLSKLIRRFLEASISSDPENWSLATESFTLEQEIDLLTAYINLEQKLPRNAFEFEINTNGIDGANYDIPPMLIQPFVENAIKHGLNYKKEGEKKLWIDFELDENEDLICTITDTGVGREAARKIQKESYKPFRSQGTKLVEKRVEILNSSGFNIKIDAQDKAGGGTIVTIKISGYYEN